MMVDNIIQSPFSAHLFLAKRSGLVIGTFQYIIWKPQIVVAIPSFPVLVWVYPRHSSPGKSISCPLLCSLCRWQVERGFTADNRVAPENWRGRRPSPGNLAFVLGGEWGFFRFLSSWVLKGDRDTLLSFPKAIVWDLPHLRTPLFPWLWSGESVGC